MKSLTVVSSARWLADDLASAGTLPVTCTLGLDVPPIDEDTVLWCSGAWATRLLKSGIAHPFLSPGPGWLTHVPPEFLGREVWSGKLGEIPFKRSANMFYKLAEHKHGLVPAGIRSARRFRSDIITAFDGRGRHLPGVEDLHCVGSDPVAYVDEFRCFIAHGKVTAASFYLARRPGINDSTVEITWDAYEPERSPDASEAIQFASRVSAAVETMSPPGYTLDVGMDADGRWSVVEANAAWSSNIYHADPAGVIESITASQQQGQPQWVWQPDQLFLDRARPLPTFGVRP